MHVLLLPSWYATDDKPWRGTFFRDQALALIRHGLDARIAFVERKSAFKLSPAALRTHRFQIESADEDGIPTTRMKAWGLFPQTLLGAALWANLTQRLVRAHVAAHGRPDVLHGHGALWGGYAAMLASRELGIPYVVTEHASSIMQGKLSEEKRSLAGEIYSNASAVIAVSRALEKSMGPAQVIPNCVDTDFFRPPLSARLRRPFTFLFVGDLVRSKRVDLLFRAFEKFRRHHPASRLIVAGAGRERVRRAESVECTGPVSRDDVRKLLWQANALVLPSEFETFGVVLIEALASGVPVIATRCGGPEEIVSAESGILIDRGDEHALAIAMNTIRVRAFRADALAQSAAARFGYEVVARQLCDVYQSVLGISARTGTARGRREQTRGAECGSCRDRSAQRAAADRKAASP